MPSFSVEGGVTSQDHFPPESLVFLSLKLRWLVRVQSSRRHCCLWKQATLSGTLSSHSTAASMLNPGGMAEGGWERPPAWADLKASSHRRFECVYPVSLFQDFILCSLGLLHGNPWNEECPTHPYATALPWRNSGFHAGCVVLAHEFVLEQNNFISTQLDLKGWLKG